MDNEYRVIIWNTPERVKAKEPWFIKRYAEHPDTTREMTGFDIDRYISPMRTPGEFVALPVLVQFADHASTLREVTVKIELSSWVNFEVTYQAGPVKMPVFCFVADEVKWTEHDRMELWDRVDIPAINRRMYQARAYRRLSLAKFDQLIEAQPVNEEHADYERRYRLPPRQEWFRIARALKVSASWLIYGGDCTGDEAEMAKIPFR